MTPLSAELLAPTILAATVLYLALTLFGPTNPGGRVVASSVCILCGLRYLWWRWTASMPAGQSDLQQLWAHVFLLFESATILSSCSVYAFMARVRDRSADVDARPGSSVLCAPVDVFVATYNEGPEILERTLVGATSIEHPDLRVWVLDDGARPWVAALAADFGCHYASRVKGEHAKAGNVNNGLAKAMATGRRPEFVLLLDADFVAARRILRRTLPLFEEVDVGIVQTPQHFFNPDPIQSNLLCATNWPDEQRFFFNHLLASKDAWGAAFCCGTSAVFRVDALQACGGMATATVTEDMLTSFAMEEVGYRTVFLNEQLSLGLAPEGLLEYTTQRSRWCLGAVQQCYTRWGFAGRGRLRLVSRISALDGVLFWAAGFPFKLMMISAPMIFWWTGTAVIDSDAEDIVYWLLPYILSAVLFMWMLAKNTVLPVMTDVTHLLAAPSIVRTLASAIVKPFGRPFKVTAKGVSTDGITVQWALLAPFALIGLGTAAGMLVSIGPFSAMNGTRGYAVNVFWSLFNIAVLTIACFVCVELPKRRRDERFISGEQAIASFADDPVLVSCTVADISLGGAQLIRARGWGGSGREGTLHFRDGLTVPMRAGRLIGPQALTVSFTLDTALRRAMIRKLFTGGYDNEVKKVRITHALYGAARRIFG